MEGIYDRDCLLSSKQDTELYLLLANRKKAIYSSIMATTISLAYDPPTTFFESAEFYQGRNTFDYHHT
jgi:hypothetical protein